uniref:Midasin n=3 Tax=Photinus pyralis TaxID=7054 RepID=A0A1Y1KUK8_PHOPY
MTSSIFTSCFINRLRTFSSTTTNNNLLDSVDLEKSTESDVRAIYRKLGSLWLQRKYTLSVTEYFKKELIVIILNVVDLPFAHQRHVQICVALSRVIDIHPDVFSFTLRYFEKHPSPFECDLNQHPPKKRLKHEPSRDVSDLDIVTLCHNLLKRAPDFFRTKWRWSGFIKKYFKHEVEIIRWHCYQIVRLLLGMNEAKFDAVIDGNLSEAVVNKCSVHSQSVHSNEDVIYEHDDQFILNDSVLRVGGVYLPVYSSGVADSIRLVEVKSTLGNLRRLALGVVGAKGILLQGPVGSGKTFLVEYLAEKTGRVAGENFVRVQLGDQTDSKMLLGTYGCTDIPGEFVWQPGVLTQAVMDGSWLLLEDIDLANMDIASVLMALLENGELTVPGYRDSVPVAPGFKLFMTQRLLSTVSGYQKVHTNAIALLEKNVLQVHVDPLQSDELQVIIQTKFPSLRTIASRMVDAFEKFTVHSTNRSNRLVSTRDLFKWCTRAVIDFDVKSQVSALNVLQNGIDVFCCSCSEFSHRLMLARIISTHLGIISEKADYFCNLYKPTFSLTVEKIKSDRVELLKQQSLSDTRLNFCFTRPSACLLERIICCVNLREPVLLVGETGTGKTSAVQYLAHIIGVKLVVINMNQQSDSSDLLGGYKPVDFKFVVSPIRKEFEEVFRSYFSVKDNKEFLENIEYCSKNMKWTILLKMMMKSCLAALDKLGQAHQRSTDVTSVDPKITQDKQKNRNQHFLTLWRDIHKKLLKLQTQLKHKNAIAFSFIEGSLVKAIKNGYWVLLDEINLANAETLECLSGLLESPKGSISLLERGDKKPVARHPEFTLFACMNPSTDIGKRDLPIGLRNRFTEFFVDELEDQYDLMMLVKSYLNALAVSTETLKSIVKCYSYIRKAALTSLSDGLGHKPHYSLRTLCRALMITAQNPCGSFFRSLYEAFCLSFLTQLDELSYKTIEHLIAKYILGSAKNANSILNQPIPQPRADSIQFEGYWVTCGSLEVSVPKDYILTPCIRRNLKDLVRVVSIGNSPVLLQGDTSVGKTSLITYLAKSSGNKCVRINNHEHTDLQEYIGSYMADIDGKLVFREGLLVDAMRNGHWIILDELNLAPTDVLEALNRVLDDNREVFIAETQVTVKAHPNFKLFATQNPPGLYGGRKMLSRAFRNRFVELHFNEIPSAELTDILHKRCEIPLSYSKKMVAVMTDLQLQRRSSAAFAGKQGFITLRDLFRWGERYHLANDTKSLYDWDQHIADEGYLLLAGRVRRVEERESIARVLEKHMKRKVVAQHLFTLSKDTSTVTKHILERLDDGRHNNIVWTYNMRQLVVLMAKALEFKEPVLLVGETGGGKTTACQLLADNNNQTLFTVNCHMHTESGDFIGGLRPVRDHSDKDINRLFEWVNGPLIQAMTQGGIFLADEISLADDSVLERLNSLLEPERCLLLAEKGADVNNRDNSELIVAHDKFYFVSTMNPGGDYGKKELSPALRNRFTEIWCESCKQREDLIAIIDRNLEHPIASGELIMDFVDWFKATEIGKKFTISVRDLLTWVNFINACAKEIGIADAYLQGACLTFLDSLGSGVTSHESSRVLDHFEKECMHFLTKQIRCLHLEASKLPSNLTITISNELFGIAPFYVPTGPVVAPVEFAFEAPTTAFNALRVLRGLQLNKAILLEGSPGVGKTSLITAIAKASGHRLLRINLSDQTDVSDLFGADFPVEGGTGGHFAWRDGPFLQALKQGDWVLLDELNLASQSVLEGLNACLDHRGEVFIPELAKTFHVKPGTRLFGCQNPLRQGGSRRGLPQSFLNRFTQVYISALKDEDLQYILTRQFPQLQSEVIAKMIKFNSCVVNELEQHKFGFRGAPWEFNLRDIARWCESVVHSETRSPQSFVQLIYSDRMRTLTDKLRMREIFERQFGCSISGNAPIVYVTKIDVIIGDIGLKKEVAGVNMNLIKPPQNCLVLRKQINVLRSLAYCVKFNWMAILVGSSGSGKSSSVQALANLVGKTLWTLPVTSSMDTTDILGGFEQVDYTRHLEEIARETEMMVMETIQNELIKGDLDNGVGVLEMWETFSKLMRTGTKSQTMTEETALFITKLEYLAELWAKLKLSTDSIQLERLARLEVKGTTLLSNIRSEKSLNVGGKFEWVNSILVKCMQEGAWLLIDNVNLCSPAVLDRLNALLEPNGVLTIGERGMTPSGEMYEVKPHNDFRLFLTMDPKNGEISRAMRNRGIEICLLNENEDPSVLNELDLKSLISHCGVTNTAHLDALLNIHRFVGDLTLGEKPNINHLLQAAFLTAEQLRRGVDLFTALTCAITDVYYKSRRNSEFNVNNPAELINEKINSVIYESGEFYARSMTLQTHNLTVNSHLEKIRQHTVLLGHENYVNDLINAFTIASSDDLKVRYAYIKSILPKSSQELCNKLFSIASRCARERHELPFDHRWLPDSRQLANANNLYVSLYYESRTYISKLGSKQKRKLSLFEFLSAVRSKKTEPKLDDILEKELLNLLDAFDKFVTKCLQSGSVKVEDDILCEVLSVLQWRFVLYRKLKTDVWNISASDYQRLIETVHIHYKWFTKAFEKLSKLLRTSRGNSVSKLIAEINRKSSYDFSALQKLSKLYQKVTRRPPPPASEEQIAVYEELRQISDDFCIYNQQNDFALLLPFTLQNPEVRPLLVAARQRAQVENDLKALHDRFVKNEDHSKCNRDQTEILPFVDYFARLAVIAMRHDVNLDNNEICMNALTVPPELLAVSEMYGATGDECLRHELNANTFLYLLNAASVLPAKFNLEECDQPKPFPQFAPILSFTVVNLLVPDVNHKGTIRATSYGNYSNITRQHQMLNVALWRNMVQLSLPCYDFIKCESQYVRKSFEEFQKDFSHCLNVENNEAGYVKGICKLYRKNSSSENEQGERDLLLVLLKQCTEEFECLSQSENIDATVNLYFLLSYLRTLLNSKLPLIDPLAKKQLKKKYCTDEIEEYLRIVRCYESQNRLYSGTTETLHAHSSLLKQKIRALEEKCEELSKYASVRCQDPNYSAVSKEILHYFDMVVSPLQVVNLFYSLNTNLTQLRDKRMNCTSETERRLKETKQLCTTFSSLVAVLKKYRYNFPDIVMPLLGSVAEFLYAATLKFDLGFALLTKYKNAWYGIDVGRDLVNIARFPTVMREQVDCIDAVKLYTRPQIREFVKNSLTDETLGKRENFRLLKCGIQDLYNFGMLDAENGKMLNGKLFAVFEDLIKVFVKSWKQQREELERKRLEEQSLYKITSKDEEAEIEEEFKKLFPSFHDQDFSDLEPKLLDDEPEEAEMGLCDDYSGIITLEDVKFVSEMHSRLLYSHTRTEWLSPKVGRTNLDFVTPLLSKCKFYQIMSKSYGECLNFRTDAELIGTLNLLVTVAQNFGRVQLGNNLHSQHHYDFYKDSNVSEVQNSHHSLDQLHKHILELLNKWPDHPTLKTIQLVIERIYNFDIASPLSRFLTGFEILLAKCHEWEENAHSGVSIQSYIQNIVRHIIDWRKIEMNIWKESLNIAFARMNEPIAKWWFYIYELVVQFIDDDTIRQEELLETLKKFVTQSNLAEFSNRLQLLLNFHYYVTHKKKTARSEILIDLLWNLYQYFKQFEANVASKIKELRSPIEKKLKDYIKIVKWKDISYWAIKQTVERTHKTLHKHIREFENILKQPVAGCLTWKPTENKVADEGIWDKKEIPGHSTNTYLAKLTIFEVPEDTDDVFRRAPTFFKRSRTLCKRAISAADYPNLIQSLDDFVTDVITSSAHLQGLEIDTTLPKEKQKAQAKGILLQKRKGLADLFKALTEIGVSYRAGVVYSKSRKEIGQFLIKPLDIHASFSHLHDAYANDDKILSIWSDCESYYYKSLSKLDSLRTFCTNPAKDLGLQNLERCSGFSEALMQTTQQLKTSLVNTSRTFYYLKHYSSCLDRYIESLPLTYLPKAVYENIVQLSKNIIVTLEQFKVVLDTCPSHGVEFGDLPILKPAPINFPQYKNDEQWLNCAEKIAAALKTSQAISRSLSHALHSIPSTQFKCAKKIHIAVPSDELIGNFDSISQNLKDVCRIFNEIPLTNSLHWLQSEIESAKYAMCQKPEHTETVDTSKFKQIGRRLLHKLLLVVQAIYKKCDAKKAPEDNFALKPDHLKTLILNNLSEDFALLDMPTVLKRLHRLVTELNSLSSTMNSECKQILLQIKPILEQVLLLYQYFLTQQVSAYRTTCKMNSILCNIFTDLTTKGFCVPPEFSEELNSEDGTQQMGGGLGLGEGEGERDVSDRIESEDQLEDAEPAGKEKDRDEDKDCKEEEKGIEMSEDFESKMQDIEPNDENEDQKSESDDDADEQMGETGKEADQLDQEIWGSDDEENNDEDAEDDEGNRGEKQGEDQLGAKENESVETDEPDEKGSKKEEKKEEINELKEPEIDDNQIDPYHGNPPKYPEPEALDLPDDLQVDDDMQENNENPDEENPFDIDTMKEQAPPPPEPEPEEAPEITPDETNADGVSDGEDANDEKDKPDDDVKEDEVKQSEEAEPPHRDEDQTNPQSVLDETQTKDEASQAMDVDDIAASDNVKANPAQNQESVAPNEEINQEDNPDKEGVGQSRMEQSMTGHKGQAMAQESISSNQSEEEEIDMKRKPGESDSKRSLGDVNESVKKKLKTIDLQEKDEAMDEGEEQQEQNAEMYKHIQDATKSDDQVLDIATKEQADEQRDVSDAKEKEKTTESAAMDEEEDVEVKEGKKQKPEKVESDQKKNKNKQHPEGEIMDNLNDIEIEGEHISTLTVQRGDETTHHTRYTSGAGDSVPLSVVEMNQIRTEVEHQFSEWIEPPSNVEAEHAWKKITSVTSSLAQNLSEQLRLVLEPTQTSRLKGDYRTGRRINMRKVIPYIASQFRKDKIWLRRTKPSKREYKIVLAIDDSSSMSDNHSKELAFESVSLISKALTLLESGQLSVLSFGETTRVLHKLVDTFTEKSGANILQNFQFLQQKTCVGKLVDFATEMLNSAQGASSALIAKLLIIVSDGRGIFSEGETYVNQAVRRAKLSNIFMVFVIVDNPNSKSSILDIRMPIFKDGKLLRIESYMDSFPFPFYIILRNINSLPNVLSDALRQWFEVVSNIDKQ